MQDTLLERSVHSGAEDRCANPANAAAYSRAIEEGIAQTLEELDAGDSGQFDIGAIPLDEPDVATSSSSNTWTSIRTSRRRRVPRSDKPGRRHFLMAMLITALLALGLVGFAVVEGYIP